VVTKTLAATAMVGAQTTINNQLKAAMAIVTETATMTATRITMRTKATAVVAAAALAVAALRQHGGVASTGISQTGVLNEIGV
jgi:hypothetical protein